MNPEHAHDRLTLASLNDLTTHAGRPCLSLYQTTHRHHPDNQQDPIRFRQLVKSLAGSLQLQHSQSAAETLVEPLEALAEDHDFWNHTLEGLAVLSAPGLLRVYLLQRPVAAMAVVADSFHTKPLRQYLQSAARYQVLALSRRHVALFEGNRNALDLVPLATAVPATMTAALGGELTEPHSTVTSHGGAGSGHRTMHHGHGGRKDEVDGDTERFFRAVDRGVLEHHSRPSGLPLLLAALPDHHHLFRKISQNPFLMANGLMGDPHNLTPDALRQRAWDIAAPQHQAQQVAWRGAFLSAAAKGLGSMDLALIIQAAATGRVATLLIEADRELPGRIDLVNGRIDPATEDHPLVDDALDDLATLVESKGGQVHILPTEGMPGQTGAAAIFRH
jgi:hypothetical protein